MQHEPVVSAEMLSTAWPIRSEWAERIREGDHDLKRERKIYSVAKKERWAWRAACALSCKQRDGLGFRYVGQRELSNAIW